MKIFVILLVLLQKSNTLFYDTYRGVPITREELKRHDKANTTFWCTSDIAPCDPREGRRIDGSCNNLDNPSRGVGHTPFVRILPAVYDKDFEPRKAISGRDLPLARYLRTRLLAEGHVPSQKFTQLFVHFLVFLSADVLSQHDTANYVLWKPYCCEPKGKTDKDCTPNMIPNDDPVHRFSNIRCFNMTRPQSFQSMGCIAKGTTPERIVSATPLLDLSAVYGNSEKVLLERFRTLRRGHLKYESENGKIWPPSYKVTSASICYLNNGPFETRCHNTPEDGANTLVGINLFVVWFWRLHNLIATELAKVNPCWDDQKLFDTARDINIATVLQMMYYEALPLLLGRENLERDGVITRRLGFRDIYNPKAVPQISLEYPYAFRWLHTMQEGSLKMYDTCGAYLKKEPIVNLTLRTGFINNNIVSITQGCFRQGAAAADYIVDPDISEIGLGPHQRAADITTSDLSKSRYFGFQSYIKYREFCYGKPIKCWSDLHGVIDPERIEVLKCSYENINDIELLAGIWLEKHIPGGSAPSTFYCLVVDQLLRNIVSDRHWYERANRPNAFTFPQLLEIRKRTIASMLCDVGDSVSKIQPHAFLRTGPFNKIVDCSQITKFDYSKWKDQSCNRPVYWNTYV